jgi:integrase
MLAPTAKKQLRRPSLTQFIAILEKADLHRRGPHQLRHSFASLLLQAGEPITYVSRQLGHKDSAITLKVYAHWLPDTSARKVVDSLDAGPSVAQPLHTARIAPFRRTV